MDSGIYRVLVKEWTAGSGIQVISGFFDTKLQFRQARQALSMVGPWLAVSWPVQNQKGFRAVLELFFDWLALDLATRHLKQNFAPADQAHHKFQREVCHFFPSVLQEGVRMTRL